MNTTYSVGIALAEIYTMRSFAPFPKLIFVQKSLGILSNLRFFPDVTEMLLNLSKFRYGQILKEVCRKLPNFTGIYM